MIHFGTLSMLFYIRVKNIFVIGFLCTLNSRGKGLLGPLWVELLEVKVVDRVSEVGPIWFRQDVCPLPETMFDDIGPFP